MLRKISQNGTTILAHRNAAAPAVAIQVWVGVGSADEQAGEFGLAHFHEHMLFKGTERRGVGQIAAEIEAAGGEINAFTSFDQTVYHVLMSSRHFERGHDVLADAIQSSIFDEDELTREKQVVLEEIQRADDSPGHVVGRLLFATLYENHPYRRPILGTAATVSDFSREGVVNFYRRHYNASNVTLVAVGDRGERPLDAHRSPNDRPVVRRTRSFGDASSAFAGGGAGCLLRPLFAGGLVGLERKR